VARPWRLLAALGAVDELLAAQIPARPRTAAAKQNCLLTRARAGLKPPPRGSEGRADVLGGEGMEAGGPKGVNGEDRNTKAGEASVLLERKTILTPGRVVLLRSLLTFLQCPAQPPKRLFLPVHRF